MLRSTQALDALRSADERACNRYHCGTILQLVLLCGRMWWIVLLQNGQHAICNIHYHSPSTPCLHHLLRHNALLGLSVVGCSLVMKIYVEERLHNAATLLRTNDCLLTW